MFVGDVRCAMTGDRIFLIIVRRQPVVFGADEGFEEAPGAASDQPRELRVFRAQLFSFRERAVCLPSKQSMARATRSRRVVPSRAALWV